MSGCLRTWKVGKISIPRHANQRRADANKLRPLSAAVMPHEERGSFFSAAVDTSTAASTA